MIHRWNSFNILWTTDTSSIVSQFIKQDMPFDILDSTFQFFEEMQSKCNDFAHYQNCGAFSLNLQPIKQSICELLVNWRDSLGQAVRTKTFTEILKCRDKMKVSVENTYTWEQGSGLSNK